MRFFKQLFDFYINANVHVAFSVYALTWITLKNFNIGYDESILYFNFYATITGYNFVKYFGVAKFHHRSLAARLKVIQVFSLICFMFMCYYAWQLYVNTLIFLVGLGIITFLYAIPFLPKKIYMDNQQNLRDISGLKVYVIAFVWAGVTVVLPLINKHYFFDTDVYVTVFQRFIFVIVLMLPFEIRDLKFDSIKLSTIPQKIGIKYTKIIGLLLLLLFLFLEYLKNEIASGSILIHLLVFFITALFLIFTNKKRNRYYSSFWVESIPIFILLLIVMIS